MCQTEEECFASRLGFRLGLTITFAILITAIICNIQMMMVDKHTIELTEKIKNGSSPKKIVKSNSDKPINDVTTQMMMSGDPPFKNHSQILIWTDREERDIFSMVLDRRIAYLRENSCPVLGECSFTFKKQAINEADSVIIAAKRYFPYGGKESGKTWLLIIPDECETEGQREEYVKALQKHASVHIYGRCGAPCPGWVTEDCLKYLDQHYKFFLVFESHICQHYLSSDLWRLLSSTKNMIPVIFGGVNYADFLPPQMGYIDALNHSPEVIGRTLKYLRSNQTAFDKYMEWRDLYDVDLEEWPCTLCHQLRLQGQLSIHNKPIVNAHAQATDGLCTSWPTLDFAQPKKPGL